MNIELEKLIYILNQRFKTNIISTDYQTMPLHGGTVGNVNLVTGIAETVDGEKLPYRISRAAEPDQLEPSGFHEK